MLPEAESEPSEAAKFAAGRFAGGCRGSPAAFGSSAASRRAQKNPFECGAAAVATPSGAGCFPSQGEKSCGSFFFLGRNKGIKRVLWLPAFLALGALCQVEIPFPRASEGGAGSHLALACPRERRTACAGAHLPHAPQPRREDEAGQAAAPQRWQRGRGAGSRRAVAGSDRPPRSRSG